MSCDKCGRQTPRSRFCKRCATEHRRENDPDPTFRWFDCPNCGGRTSGRGVVCADCRRNGGDGQ